MVCWSNRNTDKCYPSSPLLSSNKEIAIPAVGTVEVVWMVRVVLEYQRLLVNDGVAFLADVFSKAPGFLTIMTGATQMPKQSQNFFRNLNLKSRVLPNN